MSRHAWVPLLFAMVLGCVASPARAADEVVMMSIQEALDSGRAAGKLDGTVKFYFGNQPAPRVLQSNGVIVANPKTNAFAKSDGNACAWAFLSALISLQDRARSLGANAVIKIASYYRKHEVISDTQYECHKGFLMAGVALRGEVVKVAAH